ncbi:uncharacterized protein LOC127650011 isoform X2 [Xyrauchen texanus]|nr:uncharacterized protein LOC127650011 isoform X2 [Xyrauchen texanus]XP_051991078.1 uncharacterized protein LOC127650011 isoform X2 [Xyrauchen texanus]
MEWSVLKMLLNSLTLQKQKKVLSDDRVRPVLDVNETQSLDDIRLNPAKELTAARGIIGSNNSLPNFDIKKDSSDPHQNTVSQNALLLAPQRRCQSIGLRPDFTLDRNDPHQNTVTQNALQLAPQRLCRSIELPPWLNMKKDSSDPHQNTVTQNALLLALQRRCQSMDPQINFRRCQSMDRPIFFNRNNPHQNTVTQNALQLAPQTLDRNDTSDSS